MNLITTQDIYDYLGIDYADPMVERRAMSIAATVETYLSSAIGSDYLTRLSAAELAKAKEISLMIAGELYDNRTFSRKERASISHLYQSILLQLQLEFDETKT